MIINQPKSEIFGSTVVTENFSIKSSPKAFQILSSNLYSNKIRAVIREYSCNALDAHRYAGNENTPFKITLPTKLQQNFIVRDYGNGLSEQEIKELFTTYFSSSKDQSNDFTGALGLGSKSAFSYTDSFSCTSFYNGNKYVYSLFLDQGEPKVTLMYQAKSDEPSGVEINIPVQLEDIYKFEREASVVFSAFDVKPNGFKDDVKINYYYEDIGVINLRNSNFVSRDSFSGKCLYARMGNVLYPISREYTSEYIDKLELFGIDSNSIIVFVDFKIGELDIAPSREQLSYDKTTISNIESKLESIFDNHISKLVEYNIDEIDKTSWISFGKSIAKVVVNCHGITKFLRSVNWESSLYGITGYLSRYEEKINSYTYHEFLKLKFTDINNEPYYTDFQEDINKKILADAVSVYTYGRSINTRKITRSVANYLDTVKHTELNSTMKSLWSDTTGDDSVVILLVPVTTTKRKSSLEYIKQKYHEYNDYSIIFASEKICNDIKKFLSEKYKNTNLLLLDFDSSFEEELKAYLSSKNKDDKQVKLKDPLGTLYKANDKTFSNETASTKSFDNIPFYNIKEFKKFVENNPNILFVRMNQGWSSCNLIFKNTGYSDVFAYDSEKMKYYIDIAEKTGKVVYAYDLKSRCSKGWFDLVNRHQYDLQNFVDIKKLNYSDKDILNPLIKLGYYYSTSSSYWNDSCKLYWDKGVYNLGRHIKLNETEQKVYDDLKQIIKENHFWIDEDLNFKDEELLEMEFKIPFSHDLIRQVIFNVLSIDTMENPYKINDRINNILDKIEPLKYIKDIYGDFNSSSVHKYSEFLGDSDSHYDEDQVNVYESFNKMMKKQQELF